MSENLIIESFINDSSLYSNFIKGLINTIYETNKSVYIFGGFLRECIIRNNTKSILNYLLNENGDIDILVKKLDRLKLFNFIISSKNKYKIKNTKFSLGNYSKNLENKIINYYKKQGLSVNNMRNMIEKLKSVAKHFKYTIYFSDKLFINIDILETPNIKHFITSNLDISINSLYYNCNKKTLKSKSEELINYTTIINHIKQQKFTIINTKRFISIIHRVFKIIFDRKYTPLYTDTYTYNYILTRVINMFKYKNKLNSFMSKNNQLYIFNNLNSDFINQLLQYYDCKCNKCNCQLLIPSIICNSCKSKYYETNSQLLNYINLNNKIIFEFTKFSINEFNNNLFNTINNLYPNYIYTKLKYSTKIKLLIDISKCKTNEIINYLKKCNNNFNLQYNDLCILSYYCIINSNYLLLKYLLKLININDISYDNYENVLELAFNFDSINICNLIYDYKLRITKSSDLLYKLCMADNSKMIELYINSCKTVIHTNFNCQFINNLIANTSYNNVMYLRDKFKFKFSTNNILQILKKNNNNFCNNKFTFIPRINELLENCSDIIDIYPNKHWNYNPIPKYLLSNHMIEYVLLCDYNISINKLIIYTYTIKNNIDITTQLISYYYTKNIDIANLISSYM